MSLKKDKINKIEVKQYEFVEMFESIKLIPFDRSVKAKIFDEIVLAEGYSFFGMIEFQRLLRPESKIISLLPGIIGGLLVYTIIALYSFSVITREYLLLLPTIFIILAGIHVFVNRENALKWIATDLSGLVYVVIPLALLNVIMNPELIPGYHTPWIILGMFIILWTHDTFAYLCGSLFGKHPLYKAISPKKSWEGSIGGFGFAIIAAYI